VLRAEGAGLTLLLGVLISVAPLAMDIYLASMPPALATSKAATLVSYRLLVRAPRS
jgi:hypothetical protein